MNVEFKAVLKDILCVFYILHDGGIYTKTSLWTYFIPWQLIIMEPDTFILMLVFIVIYHNEVFNDLKYCRIVIFMVRILW